MYHIYVCTYNIYACVNSNYLRRIKDKQESISYENIVYDLVTFQAESRIQSNTQEKRKIG